MHRRKNRLKEGGAAENSCPCRIQSRNRRNH